MLSNQTKEEWKAVLTKHFTQEYAAHPLPAREKLSKAQEYQCRILGGALIGWMDKHGPRLLQEREFLHTTMGVEKEPAVVILSDIPGLVAARQILARRPPSIFYLPPASFESFLAHHPDPKFRWHVVYSSHFIEQLDEEALNLAREKFPIASSESYWLHSEESTIGQLFVRGGEHLWKWDGSDTVLLEEGLRLWLS